MKLTINLEDVVEIGKPKLGKINAWRMREITTGVFKEDPLVVLREGINNAVEAQKNGKPEIEISYGPWRNFKRCIIITDSAGGVSKQDFMFFAESKKKGSLGRYGHGFKDSALNISPYFIVFSQKDSFKVTSPLGSKTYSTDLRPIPSKRTSFIVPLSSNVLEFRFSRNGKEFEGEEAVKRYIQFYCNLALFWNNITIKFNGEELKPDLPKGIVTYVNIPFGKGREAKGIFIENAEEQALRISSQGGYYIDELHYQLNGLLLLDMAFLAKEDGWINPVKKLIRPRRSWKQVERTIVKWMKKEGIYYKEPKLDLRLKELTKMLGPLFSGIEGEPIKLKMPKVEWGPEGMKARITKKGHPREPKMPMEIQLYNNPKDFKHIDIEFYPVTLRINKGNFLDEIVNELSHKEWKMYFLTTVIERIRSVSKKKDFATEFLEERRAEWSEIDKTKLRFFKRFFKLG